MALRYAVPGFLVLALAVLFGVGLNLEPTKLPSALIDRPVPAFDLGPAVDGVAGLATADLAGKPAIINVFASWCVPCRIEHPQLLRIARDERIGLYGIDYKDAPEDVARWLAELGNPFARIGADRDGRAAIEFGVYGVPETFFIDRVGRIRYRHVGPITERDFNEIVRPLIAELAR